MEEKKLVAACIKGDHKSQKLLYDTYSGQMYSICLRYCPDQHKAQEALQNGFIKVFRNIEKFRNDGPLGAWIRMIMVRASIDQLDLQKKQQALFTNDGIENYNDTAEEWHESMTYDELIKLINRLPLGYKMVFTMYVLDDLSHAEIAKTLGITESTSRTQLMKARSLIKKQLLEKNYLL